MTTECPDPRDLLRRARQLRADLTIDRLRLVDLAAALDARDAPAAEFRNLAELMEKVDTLLATL